MFLLLTVVFTILLDQARNLLAQSAIWYLLIYRLGPSFGGATVIDDALLHHRYYMEEE